MSRDESKENAGKLDKADYEKLAAFRYQLRRFQRVSEDLCRAHGLTPLQYQLLLQVMGQPGQDWAGINELAERLQARHHGVVALIDRCEKLQLVERRPGRSDRRQVEIHLRPKGRQLLEQLASLHQPELRLLRTVFAAAGASGIETLKPKTKRAVAA